MRNKKPTAKRLMQHSQKCNRGESLKEEELGRLLAVLETAQDTFDWKKCERIADIAHAYNIVGK